MSDLSQFELRYAGIQDAVDAVDHAFVVYGADERFRFCNRKHREWYAPIGQLLTPGRPMEDILRAWHRVIKNELTPKLTEDEYVTRTRARYRRASGVEIELPSLHRWIAVAEHRMSDGGVVSVRRDITRLKKLEEELQDRHRLLHDLAELSYNWYWRQDENFRYVEISDGVTRHGRFNDERWFGKTRWESGVRGLTDAQWQAHREQLERHEPYYDLTYSALTDDGEVRWFASSGKPIFDANGQFKGYHGIGRDVTARRTAEEELRESEARFKALTELSADWYWEQDEDFRFTRMEGRAIRGFVDIPENMGKQRWELRVEPPEGGWGPHVALLEAHQPFQNLEYVRVDESGGRHWLSVSGEPRFAKSGKFIGYRGISKEVTSRKEAEQKLEQLARYDELTGLANRLLLAERIQQGSRWRSARSVTVRCCSSTSIGYVASTTRSAMSPATRC